MEGFWVKVKKTNDCWQWTGTKDRDGYGRFRIPGKGLRGSHRIAWSLVNGTIPIGLCVLHKCDNPSCVNPDHLFLGTQQDNIKDMVAKGRQSKMFGLRNPKCKLTDDQVREIRIAYTEGISTQKELRIRYGVSVGQISDVVNNKSRMMGQDLQTTSVINTVRVICSQ